MEISTSRKYCNSGNILFLSQFPFHPNTDPKSVKHIIASKHNMASKPMDDIIGEIIRQALTPQQIEISKNAPAPKLIEVLKATERLKATIFACRMTFESQVNFLRTLGEFFDNDDLMKDEIRDKMPQAYGMVPKVSDEDVFHHPEFIRDKNALVHALFNSLS